MASIACDGKLEVSVMPDSPQWIAAKSKGDRAEVVVAEWFRGRGFEPFRTIGDAPFDLLLQSTVEVKRDLQAVHTGNVAIETSYRGQPSGIMTSTAHYWAIVLDVEALIFETTKLRDFVLSTTFREVPAGDRKASTVRLVPLAKIKATRLARVIPLSTPTGGTS